MAKNKKQPAKKTPAKAKTKAKAKPAVKKVAKKPVAKKVAKSASKKSSAVAPKAVQKKPVVPAPDKKPMKPFVEEPRKSVSPQPMGSPMLKDPNLEEELGEDEVDIAVEADEDVEEELTLDGDEEDADFPEKPESLLDDPDDYHTH